MPIQDKTCPACNRKYIKHTSQYCLDCWRKFDKESAALIPSAHFLAELTQAQRALVLLHCAGVDISDYFDTTSTVTPMHHHGQIEIDHLDHLDLPANLYQAVSLNHYRYRTRTTHD